MIGSVVIVMLLISLSSWGFFAHRRINRLAVFTLPTEMIGFYKQNIVYLTENAINPDRRRYAIDEEAARHYIDLDIYGDSAWYKMPHNWFRAIDKYTEDTLQAYGIAPWHINLMKIRLTKAFKVKDFERILRLSGDIGHYIADANVPLHTTENYNGQFTGQRGIHGFWESRLPELYSDSYDFFVGKASYIDNSQEEAWRAVKNAQMALDSVLLFEKELSQKFPDSKKYSFEAKGATTAKVYSQKFSYAYHQMLNGMVERRMRASIKMVGDFWYTCWVDAGQPDLSELKAIKLTAAQKKELKLEKAAWEKRNVKSRDHN